MFKRTTGKIAAFSISLILALSSVVYGATPTATSEDTKSVSTMKKDTHRKYAKGEGFAKLLQQLGITENDMKKARKEGKSLFDVAKNKGFTPEQVREMLIKNNTESINKAVTEGKLTKAEGEEAIKKMKEKLSTWDGTMKHHCKHGKGEGFVRLTEIKELGLTKADIASAKDSGKSIFEVVKAKKGLSSDQVKSLIIKSKTDAINTKVTEGKLTREKADSIISNIKTKIEKWDGTIKSHKQS